MHQRIHRLLLAAGLCLGLASLSQAQQRPIATPAQSNLPGRAIVQPIKPVATPPATRTPTPTAQPQPPTGAKVFYSGPAAEDGSITVGINGDRLLRYSDTIVGQTGCRADLKARPELGGYAITVKSEDDSICAALVAAGFQQVPVKIKGTANFSADAQGNTTAHEPNDAVVLASDTELHVTITHMGLSFE